MCHGADLAIQIPVSNFQDPNGMYTLDYSPPIGSPEPNTTFFATEVSNSISFTDGLPGTKYNFRVYYTNDTIRDWLTWTASITTSKSIFLDNIFAFNFRVPHAARVQWKECTKCNAINKYNHAIISGLVSLCAH